MFGILLDEYDSIEDWGIKDLGTMIFAPLLIPIFFGMFMNNSDQN
jgi:hypothetical protein